MKRIASFFLRCKFFILVACALGIAIDIFLLDAAFNLILLFLTGLWVLTLWFDNFEGRISVAGGLIFLALCPFLLIFVKETIAEKTAIWAYMFLIVGVAQVFIEYLREERKSAKKEEE